MKDTTEDKIFAAMVAFGIVMMGLALIGLSIWLLVAMWQEGIIHFVSWSAISIVIFYITRNVYKRILDNNLLR